MPKTKTSKLEVEADPLGSDEVAVTVREKLQFGSCRCEAACL